MPPLTRSSSRSPDSKTEYAVTTADAQILIQSDPDYIYSKRFNYSLNELKERYPDGCPDRIIAAVLMITEDDVQIWYEKIVEKLRNQMGLTDSL
jgi:hypothetical protein